MCGFGALFFFLFIIIIIIIIFYSPSFFFFLPSIKGVLSARDLLPALVILQCLVRTDIFVFLFTRAVGPVVLLLYTRDDVHNIIIIVSVIIYNHQHC